MYKSVQIYFIHFGFKSKLFYDWNCKGRIIEVTFILPITEQICKFKVYIFF